MTDAAFYQLGPLREYLEDPTVFEIRINCFQEVICDTFSVPQGCAERGNYGRFY